MATYGNLVFECNVMCYYASQVDDGSVARIREFVHRETNHLKELVLSRDRNISDATSVQVDGQQGYLGSKIRWLGQV